MANERDPEGALFQMATTTVTSLVSDQDGLLMDLEVDDKIHYSREATIFAAVCASVFTIVGVTGNLLTVVALLKCPKLRSQATSMFVISLAISDLLFSAVNLPLTASRYIHQEWRFGKTMCRLFPFFFYGNVAASLMSMVAITINRYILIAYHTHYLRIYNKVNIFLMVLAVWVFSFGMLVPPLAEVWGSLGYDHRSFSCTILRKDDSSPKKFLMLFGFLMPCLVIVGCYSAIFAIVRRSRKNVQSHIRNRGDPRSSEVTKKATGLNSQQKREDMRLTKMMLTIFLCFLVSFMPLTLVNVSDEDVKFPFLHIIASILAWASAIINPFIYAFKNKQYQQAFARIVCIQVVSSHMENLVSSGAQKIRNKGLGIEAKQLGAKSEDGPTDRDSKVSVDRNAGSSSKTFLTDVAIHKASNKLEFQEAKNEPCVFQIEEKAAGQMPEGKIWCKFPEKKDVQV